LTSNDIDRFLSIPVVFTFFFVILASIWLVRRRRTEGNYQDILIASILWPIYAAILFGGIVIQRNYFASFGFTWNWVGKALTIIATVIMLFALPNIDCKRAGVTFRQRPGTFWSTLLVIMVVTTAAAFIQRHQGVPDVRAQTWLYQLLMPSIDEELFYRGLLLYYVARGLGDLLPTRIWNVDLSVWLVTVLFALVHAVGFDHRKPILDVGSFLFILVPGYLLGWARQRTGSVVLPVVGHTLTNTLYRLL
jgi:uncharacterized protein